MLANVYTVAYSTPPSGNITDPDQLSPYENRDQHSRKHSGSEPANSGPGA